MFGGIGPWEIIIILTVALLVFGKRLPEVGRSLGRGIVEFKKGLQGMHDEIEQAGDGKNAPPSQTSEEEKKIPR